MGKAYGPEFLVQISMPFWVPVSGTMNGRCLPPSAEHALDHFSTARAARKGNAHGKLATAAIQRQFEHKRIPSAPRPGNEERRRSLWCD
jgi:hypothetical protein